jgi:hypothetical protein
MKLLFSTARQGSFFPDVPPRRSIQAVPGVPRQRQFKPEEQLRGNSTFREFSKTSKKISRILPFENSKTRSVCRSQQAALYSVSGYQVSLQPTFFLPSLLAVVIKIARDSQWVLNSCWILSRRALPVNCSVFFIASCNKMRAL